MSEGRVDSSNILNLSKFCTFSKFWGNITLGSTSAMWCCIMGRVLSRFSNVFSNCEMFDYCFPRTCAICWPSLMFMSLWHNIPIVCLITVYIRLFIWSPSPSLYDPIFHLYLHDFFAKIQHTLRFSGTALSISNVFTVIWAVAVMLRYWNPTILSTYTLITTYTLIRHIIIYINPTNLVGLKESDTI